ncbi:hypothetical protein HOB10_01955 [Candidatus Parcubacteria bacterium]|nr:hypothetical protein [Candidatus Parcubacteria bacterium]
MLRRMEEFEASAAQEEDPVAKSLYLQGRNLLACALGRELLPEPDISAQAEEAVSEPTIPEQVVAIKVGSKVYAGAMKQSLAVMTDLRIETYFNNRILVQDLLAGKICGIISVSFKDGRADSIIRHDLKNLPGWDVARANSFPLPPVSDIREPVLLVNILELAAKMHQGEFFDRKEEKFDLEDHLAELRSTMLAPKSQLSVMVVDDMPDEVAGMMRLLNVWPGGLVINEAAIGQSHIVDSDEQSLVVIIERPDIVLLDEDIGDIKGSDVAEVLLDKDFEGILASITGGECPEFTRYHFGSKTSIQTSRQAAERFISFMNKLIDQVS